MDDKEFEKKCKDIEPNYVYCGFDEVKHPNKTYSWVSFEYLDNDNELYLDIDNEGYILFHGEQNYAAVKVELITLAQQYLEGLK